MFRIRAEIIFGQSVQRAFARKNQIRVRNTDARCEACSIKKCTLGYNRLPQIQSVHAKLVPTNHKGPNWMDACRKDWNLIKLILINFIFFLYGIREN